MLEVFFESNQEAFSFCEHLFYYNKKIELYWKTHEEWGNQLVFKTDLTTNGYGETVAKSMVDVFMTHRLNILIKEVIKRQYYYTDNDEIERILDYSHWIVTGKDRDSKQLRGAVNTENLLLSLFKSNIKDSKTIHFDSIINFRLTIFKEYLVKFVGLAIDEYKREEEHQAFIHTLREYIMNKKSVHHTVHVIQGSTFTFFKQNGKPFSHVELKKLMQKEPLYIVGLDENEWNLAPLIAMAPKQVYIYGDYPSEPKTLTVINIFQEKVTFEPYKKFPFTNFFKKT